MTATPPQQYCLRWNNYQNNLTNVFDQLLQSEAFVDVSLACDGHFLKAHKMVLSACSPYFQSLFADNPCSHPIVILKDVKWAELKAIVEFMYRGEINVSQEQLAPLLKVAEVLKIRGLADVSRGTSAEFVSAAAAAAAATDRERERTDRDRTSATGTGIVSTPGNSNSNNPATAISDSDGEIVEGRGSGRVSLHPSGSAAAAAAAALSTLQLQHPGLFHHPAAHGHSHAHAHNGHHLLASLGRMRLPTKRRRVSMSDERERSLSPADSMEEHSHSGSGNLEIESNPGDYENSREGNTPGPDGRGSAAAAALMSSLGLTPTPANTPTGVATGTGGSPNVSQGSVGASGGHGGISSSLLTSLHNAAAAAAAAAAGSSNPGSSSSISNDLDLKPGIVEMIREEERAKMLESSHGWLGPSAASTLSDSYQYQIQSLWQKCWSTNQSGMVHALRFRERGPLKSWRPETMAEAIFSVLREGLSLSQAARKYDIPYPTFVLYANRVHNMLGPSADGCSDMRPKGRGRPQRILLGSWPEDHIRGVIRAVVFRDTAKDDIPFVYNRDSSLCMPPPQAGSSHNGLDMTLHPHFAGSPMNHFLNLQHSGGPGGSSSSTHSSNPAALLGSSSSTNDSLSCMNPGASVQVELGHSSGSSSSNSNSPLGGISRSGTSSVGVQQIQLMAAAAAAAAAQEQREQNLLTSFKSSSLGRSRDEEDEDESQGPIQMPEILQIKAEIPFDDDLEDDGEDGMRSEDEEDSRRNPKPPTTSPISPASVISAASAVVPGPNSVITGGIGLGLGLQVEGHFRQRDMNTPSPHFQPS